MTRRLASIALPAAAALSLAAAAPASATVPFTTSSFPVTSPMGIAAGDVDANGKTDLVTANSVDLTAGVFLGDGGGAFMPGLGSPLAIGGTAAAIAAGDLDHDGRADLVVPDYRTGASTDSTDVEIFLSTPSGFVPAPTLTAGHGTSDVTIADLNADGDPDLAISNAVDDTMSIFIGDGTGTFVATPASPLGVASRDMVTGDFDGDGNVDIATVLNTGSRAVQLLLGDGTGAFADGGMTTVGTAYNGLAATDFDADGDLDVVTSGGAVNGTVVALRNDGTGTLATASTIPMPTGPSSIAAADFDADGHPDIAVTQQFSAGKIGVLMGDGRGGFGTPVDWTTAASPFQVITTDVDGDTRADLAVTNYGADKVTVLRNDALPVSALAKTPCVSRRTITIHPPKHLSRATVTITMGKRRIDRIARAGATVKVRLTGLPRGTVRVTLATKTARQVRTYKTCA